MRKFTSTGAQVAVVAVRPEGPILSPPPTPAPSFPGQPGQQDGEVKDNDDDDDDDAKSDASYDPLFDEPDEEEGGGGGVNAAAASASSGVGGPKPAGAAGLARAGGAGVNALPRGPPPLNSSTYGTFSSDVLMTASVDGSIVLWDRRAHDGRGVGRLETSSKTPPWCVSVS